MIPHLGTSYPAILAIALLGNEDAYEIVDVPKHNTMNDSLIKNTFPKLKEYIKSCKSGTKGSYRISAQGEEDMRATYIVVLCAALFGFLDDDEIIDGIAEYIVTCQSYEGGISPIPGTEAHGGYTYCAIAAMYLLGKLHLLNIPRLLNWAVNKQKLVEGGFCGRTNKLVDSCYSTWMGSMFTIVNEAFGGHFTTSDGHLLYDQLALQKYILLACQDRSGGLVDKPGKSVDAYHTSYSLGGLSLSQRLFSRSESAQAYPNMEPESAASKENFVLFNDRHENYLKELHPAVNVPRDRVKKMMTYFKERNKDLSQGGVETTSSS